MIDRTESRAEFLARIHNRLTTLGIKALSKVGRHADGGNLYLSISKNGGRRWVFLYRWNGKPTEMGLGSIRNIDLRTARELATEARRQLGLGISPLKEKQNSQTTVPTFGEVALNYIETNKSEWRNQKHVDQWSSSLTKHAKYIWDLPVNEIDTPEILKVLKPIWGIKQETASRLRGRIERILASAHVNGYRSGNNPAQWRTHLEFQLPKRGTLTRGHHKALPYKDIPIFIKALRNQSGSAARALEYTILCAARTGEVLNANWDEIDDDNAIWIIPAHRMKAGREHRVPLSKQSLNLLLSLNEASQAGCIFHTSISPNPLSNMAMAQLLKRMGVNATVHGFRSSFRDWVSEETSYPHEIAESALAHTIKNKTEAAYRRGDLLTKRREMMQKWSNYCLNEVETNE